MKGWKQGGKEQVVCGPFLPNEFPLPKLLSIRNINRITQYSSLFFDNPKQVTEFEYDPPFSIPSPRLPAKPASPAPPGPTAPLNTIPKPQQCYYPSQTLNTLFLLQLLNMLDQQHNLFIKYTKKIRNFQHFEKILDREEYLLDFKPFKIQNLTPQKALKTYKILQERYYITKQITPLNHGWYQYEKGLFVWFMVIHSYYLTKEGADLGLLPEKRGLINFDMVSSIFFNKSTLFLEFQFLNLIKTTDKIIWTEIQDTLLTNAIRKLPQEKWTEISLEIFVSSQRQRFISSKHCRERWHNHLDTTKIKGNWEIKEDIIILEYVMERGGKKWSKMKIALGHRRTEHMIKNRYHSLITRNRLHRNDKEYEIAKKVLTRLRAQAEEEVYEKPEAERREIEEQKKPDPPALKQDKKKEVNLKQQNISEESESSQKPAENAAVEEEIVQNQYEIKKEKNIKEEYFQPVQETYKSVYQQQMQEDEPFPQNDDENNIYPFENYNYQLEINNYKTQMFEYHKNQMMFYQQYMTYGHAIPTAETYMNPLEYQPQPQNPNPNPSEPDPIIKHQ